MNIQTASSLLKGGQLRLLFGVNRLLSPFYRLSFLAAAASCGLLRLLAPASRSLPEVCAGLAIDESMQDGLAAWLELGVRLGELAKDDDRYRLAGYLARKLASPKHDEVAALVQEIVSFHHRLMLETPARLQKKEPWRLAEHDSELIARSSRIMEPFMFGVIDWALPKSGTQRLLEVGCGAGTYLRYAVQRNPELRAIGIELDPAVAESTRRAVAKWGLAQRITVEAGDVRVRACEAVFDVVTLYNVIYYFPASERIALLAKLASFLKPGGRLILSTSCQGGSPGMQVLDIWMSNTEGLGRLPIDSEVVAQLRSAGFVEIRSKRAIPGEPYYAFVARKPEQQTDQSSGRSSGQASVS